MSQVPHRPALSSSSSSSPSFPALLPGQPPPFHLRLQASSSGSFTPWGKAAAARVGLRVALGSCVGARCPLHMPALLRSLASSPWVGSALPSPFACVTPQTQEYSVLGDLTLLAITLLWEHSVLGGAPCLESIISGEILAGQCPVWGAPCLGEHSALRQP